MCGIAGRFTRRHDATGVPLVEASLRRMHRRGPDAHGVNRVEVAGGELVLGHARLSIIDLSDAGLQPMWSLDDRFGIVFNGEIYNYIELRAELMKLGHHFSTATDTEVLLTAWRQWGEAALPRLVGMFAFAVVDVDKARLTCVRDAFGIKPFFYDDGGEAFCFASDMLGMKAVRGRPLEVEWQRAWDYLAHGDYDSGSTSFCAGVRHLEPAHLLEVDLQTGRAESPRPWWRPVTTEQPADATSVRAFLSAAEQLRGLFLDSVQLHMRSDVPLGAALSGGIDSSSIVCAMRAVAPDAPLRTFSFIADDEAISEERYVDVVNSTTGAIAHKVRCGPDDLLRDLDDLVETQGEPFGSTSIYAQYRVFHAAKAAGVTVTLDGQGADELLAGYFGYPGARFRSLVETDGLPAAVAFLSRWSRWPGRRIDRGMMYAVMEFVDDGMYSRLRDIGGRRTVPGYLQASGALARGVALRHPRHIDVHDTAARGRRVMAAMASHLMHRGLPGLLRHGDRNAMRFSVESRVPFLTLQLASFLLGLPEAWLISPQGETKRILRAALRGLVPDTLLDRRDKIGFQTPPRWLTDVGLGARLDAALARDRDGLLDGGTISATLTRLRATAGAPPPWLWRAINFTLWRERVVDAS
jgi:asparagine synthase (glutamine-hydrolysing)